MAGYAKVPNYAGRQSGSPADVEEFDLRRYLSEKEMANMSATEAYRVAHERRHAEYDRRAQDGTVESWDSDGDGKGALRQLIEPIADLVHPDNHGELRNVLNSLWWTHRGALVLYTCLFIAMMTHMAVYHWAQGHSIGQFPLVSSFIHDDGFGQPVIAQRDIDNIPFFWMLIEIPIGGMLYHGLLTMRPRHFSSYFFDNILHHIGSLKYIFYAIAYAFVTVNVFALVGNSNVILLVLAWIAGGAAYAALHSASYQGGSSLKNYTKNMVNARSSASKAFQSVFGYSLDDEEMHAGANEGEHAAEFVGNVAVAAVELPATAVEASIGLTTSLLPEAVTNVGNAVVDAITPPDTIMSPYGVAAVIQFALHAIVLVFFVEACHNTSIRALPWIASFAFFWYFLPTTAEVTMHILYFQRVGLFKIYAYKEMVSTTVHTAILVTFCAIIYFFSTQYGTIYV